MGDREDLRGRTLGEFIVRERIGEGGFGAVYRCEQPLLGREAVVKVLHHGLRGSEVVLQRFMREAQLASRLDHPYAAHVYAFGVDKEDGLFWIAMELVQGTALDKWLRERGKLELEQLVPFFERVAEVVQTAHERGIVHRDLKPSNIMVIERAGRLLPKLLDFGIAKLHDATVTPPLAKSEMVDVRAVGEAATMSVSRHPPPKLPSEVATLPPTTGQTVEHAQPLTQANAALGSPPYMSPEQWLDPQSVGPPADLYALGIVAYEALAGRRPFSGTTLAALADLHCNGVVPPLDNGAPPALDAFFRRALAKRAADRPGTALELAAELRIAAGLATAPVDLPKLDDGVRDIWLADGPQPIAEAIAALDGARNVHQGRDAARDLFRNVLRYVLAIALAARAQVRGDHDDPALRELLRAVRRRDLDDDERVRLLRFVVRPFESRRGAYPVPELVDAVGAFDEMIALHPTSDAGGTELLVRSQLAQVVVELTRLLRATAFILDYSLVVARDGVAERWMGLRRQRRALATIRDASLEPLRPVLIDRDGRVAVLLWPIVQVIAPATGAELEPFVFDGRGRHGARLISAPAGFEHHDPDVWEWLGEHVIGDVDPGGDAPADERAPYLGLASFAEADADRFVGREREIDAFSNRLRQRPLQVVVGASGAGKSSFVHAGILPSLPPGWRAISIRPGTAPLSNLATRLGSAGVSAADLRPLLEASPAAATTLVSHAAGDGAIVIVVDQLEELFTLCRDSVERERFAAVIAQFTSAAESRIRVICTVRDDFLMDVESLAALRASLSPSLYLLGNPSRDDLVRTVVEPARRAGYELSDPELANDMVDAVADRPGALALLSFTASRLWELRDRRFRQLTRKAYDAMGGVGGALGQHAEDTLATLAADEQRLVQIAFRHLVTSDETRAVLSVAELRQRLASPRADAVIDKLVAARLLAVGDEGRIEIIHEALIGAWPRLQQWVREDSDGTRLREQLRGAAKQWDERGRQRGLLWRDEVLADLETWRRRDERGLTELELAFADTSRAMARRSTRVRRGLVIAGFAALGGVAIAMFALRNNAVESSDLAHQQAIEIQQRLVTSFLDQARTKLLDGRRWEALAKLTEAQKAGAVGAAIETMRTLARAPARALKFRIAAHNGEVFGARYSPDGHHLVTFGEDGVALWDPLTGALQARLYQGGPVRRAAFDHGGGRLATIGDDGMVHVYEPQSGRELIAFAGHTDRGQCVAWSRNDDALVTTGDDKRIKLWDPVTGLQRASLSSASESWNEACGGGVMMAAAPYIIDPKSGRGESTGGEWISVRFDRSGERFVATSPDNAARVWDARGHQMISELRGSSDMLMAAAFSPDGKRVVAGGRDAITRVWDVATGELQLTLGGHQGTIWSAEFSSDGRRIVTSADDGSARVWDSESGAPLAVLEGHSLATHHAEFSPDGHEVVTASFDGPVAVWDASPMFEAASTTATYRSPFACRLASSPDRHFITIACPDQTRVWNATEHRAVATLPGAEYAVAIANRAVTISARRVRVWELPSARVITELELPADIDALAAGTDRFGIASEDRSVRWISAETGEVASTYSSPHRVSVLAALGGERWYAAANRGLSMWNRDNIAFTGESAPITPRQGQRTPVISHGAIIALFVGKELWLAPPDAPPFRIGSHRGNILGGAFDRDGKRVVTCSTDGSAIIWDTASHTATVRLTSSSKYLADAAFDDTDALVIAVDGNGALQIFDAANGAPLGRVDGAIPFPRGLTRAQDGTLMVFGGNGAVETWRIPRDTDPATSSERDLACKAPPNQTEGTCPR